MRPSTFLSGLALFAVVTLAHAHAHLKMSTPADASVVSVSPPSIVLKFSEAARLTAAWIQKDDGPKQKLTPLPDKPAVEVSVALPALEPGIYVVSWRALSDDGHVVPGQIHFTLSAASGADHPARH
jgi:copper transport protein